MKKSKIKNKNAHISKRLAGHQKKKRPAPSQAGGPPLPDALRQALAFHKAGRLAQAETLYRQILQAEPNHPDALHYLGMLAYQAGNAETAVELLKRALAIRPDNAEALNNLGNALQALGKQDDAIASYRQVIALQPRYAEAHYNLGNALRVQNQIGEAIACYQRALVLKPDYFEACYNLGILLQILGKAREAEASFRRVVTQKPDFAWAFNNLGFVLQQQDKLEEAEASYRRALTLKPDFAEALNNLGNVLHALHKPENAEDCYRHALRIKPNYVEALRNLGIELQEQGKLDEAVVCCERALALEPDDIETHNSLGHIFLQQGRLNEALTRFRYALSLRPDFIDAHNNLLMCLNYIPGGSVLDYLDKARRFGRVAAGSGFRFSSWSCTPNPRKLCVGMVSGDLHNHPVGYFLESMLAHIDPSRIALIAYPTKHNEDELAARIRSRFVAWKPLAGLNDDDAARLIKEDGVHILLDLSGHTGSNRLPIFARKPAPIQATWLGYFASTGLTEMDYLLADRVSVPAACRQYFTEKVWYLPETRLCFSPPVVDEEVPSTPLPALTNDFITFGCFQNIAKLNDAVLEIWGRIFQKLPQARLRVQNSQLISPAVRDQLQRRLTQKGIMPKRVTMHDRMSRRDYLATHSRVDIILDTFPFPGGTTTCEALWMGVPTITLAGETMLARQGASLLTYAGLVDWIAADEKDYTAKAVAHASDLEKLARLRAGLRKQVLASPLFDGERFARNFETVLWGMWDEKGRKS